MTRKALLNKDKHHRLAASEAVFVSPADDYYLYDDEHARRVAAKAVGERLAAETLARTEKKLGIGTKPTKQKLRPRATSHRIARGTSANATRPTRRARRRA